jgi:hypothetical protein
VSASRSASGLTFRSWTSTALYPSKCGIVKKASALAARTASLSCRSVRGADGEDRSLGRGLVAEPLQVGLAERAFPRERFATDGPGPVTVAVFVFALRDLGQCGGHPSYVVERRHPSTVLPCVAGTRHGERVDGWSYILQSRSMGEFADNENQAFADAPGRT